MTQKKHRKKTQRKQELDQQRTDWRKHHKTLNGRIILFPDGSPEHINARGSKALNWFWKKILLEIETQEIPAVIANLQDRIKAEQDTHTIQMYRTMIGMAEDAYQLKKLDDIKDYDTELMLEKKPVYNAETGVIYRSGMRYTTDYNEDESAILLRDIEGILRDVFSSETTGEQPFDAGKRNNLYREWDYMEKK